MGEPYGGIVLATKSSPTVISDSPITDPGSGGKNLEVSNAFVGSRGKLIWSILNGLPSEGGSLQYSETYIDLNA